MKVFLAIASSVLWSATGLAQFTALESTSTRSMSGQFIVNGSRLPAVTTVPLDLLTNASYLELEPASAAVSCERIKQALWADLDLRGQWNGRIQLNLHATWTADEPVTIISDRYPSGWAYRLELPQFVERQRFVRAVVQTLLQERANRNAGSRPAEIPFWLTEGLTRHLQASRPGDLILTPPRPTGRALELVPVVVEERRRDPLATARQRLRENPPLSLAELTWPSAEHLSGEAAEVFGCSAQLFVTELLSLKGGRDCLRAMLDELAACYNWQTAFFRAFQPHFARQLDLEKWWDLQLVHFTGRDPLQLWTLEESWRKLDQILRAPVEIRRTTNALPSQADVSLQAVIREWDSIRQGTVLNNKLRELELARLRIAPQLGGLVEGYHQTLANYLRQRGQLELVLPVARVNQPRLKPLARDTLRRLHELDAQRTALRPESGPAPEASATNSTPVTLWDTRFPPPAPRIP
ncbi:MAG: hypothetical protein KJ070_00115 [Verrucomicrobia bacterium]|nr:hypothetical protein [Verrucomicrobiota bacterium]